MISARSDKAGLRTTISAEAKWLLLGSICTFALGTMALVLSPDQSGIVPALRLMPQWILASFAMTGALVAVATVRLLRRKVEHPLDYWWQFSMHNRARIAVFVAGVLLTGLNMISFMWVKRLLNYLVPFWADPLLGRVDQLLFFTDPWRLLGWLNNSPMAQLYHRGWFALMVLTLVLVLTRPPSASKTALLCTYFLLWSVFGPVVHTLLPAAGPIFYARLGHGDHFAGLLPPAETRQLADYLWRTYAGSRLGPVSGISAMPSMHIAMMAWMALAVHTFARHWFAPMAAAAVLIFLLSVALGWHYAIDGLLGAGGAVVIWAVCARLLSPRRFAAGPGAGLQQAS